MNTRTCGLCGIEKPLEEYQRNKSNPLGRAYWCKECRREFDRQRNLRPDRRLYVKQWEQSERGKELRSLSRKKDRLQNRDKYRAHRLLNKLIKEGMIKRMTCEICGKTGNGHHPDYSKPVEVVWLCRKHHAELNRKLTTK